MTDFLQVLQKGVGAVQSFVYQSQNKIQRTQYQYDAAENGACKQESQHIQDHEPYFKADGGRLQKDAGFCP